MAEDQFDFAIKALVWKNILQNVPQTTPLRRETDIQIHKLERMVEAFNDRFPATIGLAMSLAQLRRAKGQHMRRLDQQSKRVDKLIAKLLVEAMLHDLGDQIPTRGRNRLPDAAQRHVRKINRSIHEHTQKVLQEALNERGFAGIKRL